MDTIAGSNGDTTHYTSLWIPYDFLTFSLRWYAIIPLAAKPLHEANPMLDDKEVNP
jgi:hypothetical protein